MVFGTAVAVWAYFGVIERLNTIETSILMMESEVSSNTEFRIRWPRGELGALPADAEQFMMTEKAALMGDWDKWAEIRNCSHPAEAKALGREISNWDQELWDSKKQQIVFQGNFLKFSQDPAALKCLMATGNKILVEASPVDNIWGIGLDIRSPNCHNPAKWQGENLLGFILTAVRSQLRFLSDVTN